VRSLASEIHGPDRASESFRISLALVRFVFARNRQQSTALPGRSIKWKAGRKVASSVQ